MYFYTASGQKVQKVVTENATVTTTDYLGGYQYQNTVLQFFPTVEGYVKNNPVNGTNSYSYVFNYTDHLGNTRLSYTKDTATGSLKILEENNYYPFGLKHNSYNVDNFQPEYKFKFEGRELQDELGLTVYPFKYRTYDPATGRFWSVDPVAESYVYNGVYNFAENRVVESIDLEGKESWYTQDGSLAIKAGPYNSKARQQLNLYSPSEVQQIKAQQSTSKQPTLSQDRLSSYERKNQEKIGNSILSDTPSKESTSKTSAREKVVEATKNISEVAEKTSKAGQITSVIVGVVGAVFLQPEVVTAALVMFEASSTVGVVGQVSKTVSLGVDGNKRDATLEGAGIILNYVTGSWANSIPGTHAVTKEAVKTASEAAVETGKTELIKDLDKKL